LQKCGFGGGSDSRVNSQVVAADASTDRLQWETIKERVIRSGTVQKLVECLIGSDNIMDSRHFNVFFATYRAFTNSGTVLELLLHRYEQLDIRINAARNGSGSADLQQSSIRSIILCWLDMYPEDFYEPSSNFEMLSHLLDFSRCHKLTDLKIKVQNLRDVYKRVAVQGGLAAQLPSMSQQIFTHGYNATNSMHQRTMMFDVGKENCVQIAEQLTYWDAELFKELLPQQCQGCVWSRRHKKGPETVYSVRATIDQFNAVAQRVMTSIVLPDCRPEFRAKIIAKWIDIARELRALKNFSSLKAVLSSLQSEPVHRWSLILPPGIFRSLSQFHELTSIFDPDDDGEQSRARQILDEEGTAKSSPLRRPQLIQNCRRTKSDVNLAESQGTVPYLGSFLTDLSMIDQASPDFTDDGLINFEKRRKEFDVIAKIRLFQSASRAYNIPMDVAFCSWFQFLPALDENQWLEICLLFHLNYGIISMIRCISYRNTTFSRIFSGNNCDDTSNATCSGGQLSNDSGIVTEDSWISDGRLSPFGIHASRSFTAPSTPASSQAHYFNDSWSSEFNPSTVFMHRRSPSGSSNKQRNDSFVRNSTNECPGSNSLSAASCTSTQSCSNNVQTPAFTLARVALDDSLQTETAATNYKCIKIENDDRMNVLIDKVLEKHLLTGDSSEYCLVQLLRDGEFQLPDKCNPYYAVAPDPSSPILSFVLRRKCDSENRPSTTSIAPSAKKLNRMKRSNLLRWSSGYL
uniref:Ral guanine nucleotide dissociation stimulator-like 1 n=1 Tax=Syphacia muris TaxID=451379 RepID=A0A0N5B0D4_9BILA